MGHPKTKTAPQQSISEIVSTNADFSTLLAAVSAAGLVEALSAEGPFTVFAPTNKAFSKIPSDTLTSLLEDKDDGNQLAVLHVESISDTVDLLVDLRAVMITLLTDTG